MKIIFILIFGLFGCTNDPVQNCIDNGVECSKVKEGMSYSEKSYKAGCEKHNDIDSCFKLADYARLLKKNSEQVKYLRLACDLKSQIACEKLGSLMQTLCYEYNQEFIYPEECKRFPPNLNQKIQMFFSSRGQEYSEVFYSFDFAKRVESTKIKKMINTNIKYQSSWLLEAFEKALLSGKQNKSSQVELKQIIQKMKDGSGVYEKVKDIKVPGEKKLRILLSRIKGCDEECGAYNFLEFITNSSKKTLSISNIDIIKDSEYLNLDKYLKYVNINNKTYIFVSEWAAPNTNFHIAEVDGDNITISTFPNKQFFNKLELESKNNVVIAYFDGGHGEPVGNCASYDPFLAYKKTEGGKFVIDENLSEKWSQRRGFKWHGSKYNDKICVNKKGIIVD